MLYFIKSNPDPNANALLQKTVYEMKYITH